jgi:hypothetical protein
MRWNARALVAALSAAAALALAGAPAAQAVDCGAIPPLSDPDGRDWTFDLDGDVTSDDNDSVNNSGAVYLERDYNHYYYAVAGDRCSHEDGGREVVYPVWDEGGLEVAPKVFVPSGGPAFVRHLWRFHNATPHPRRVLVHRWNTADYATTDFVATSSGDEAVTPADDWLAFGNGADPTDPGVGLLWQGAGDRRTAVDALFDDCCTATPPAIADGRQSPNWRYAELVLAPGETAVILTFIVVRDTANDARDAIAQFANPPGQALAGMSEDELRAVRNFTFPDHDRDGRANAADNCPFAVNGDQANLDGDGEGDACDADDDGDGLTDVVEGELRTDPARADTDGDGRPDGADPCPRTRSASVDGCPAFDVSDLDRTIFGRVPAKSSSAVVRRRGRRLVATGSLTPPDGLSAARACGAGRVEVRAKRGRRTVGRRKARLGADCTFSVAVRLRTRRAVRTTVRWLGNDFLAPETIRR